MNQYLIFLTFCFGLVSCCSNEVILPQDILVINWTSELQKKEPFEPPYLVHFKKGNKELYFVAAQHDERRSSDTFRLIEQLFNKKSFHAAIIEGYPFIRGRSSERYISHVKKMVDGDVYNGGEPSYTALLAYERGIPFFGGEPHDLLVKENILAKRYDVRDLLGYYFIRGMPFFSRQNRTGDHELEKEFYEKSKRDRQSLSLGEDFKFSISDFKQWYRERNGRDFKLPLTDNEYSPDITGKYFTQKIAVEIEAVRDPHIINVIAKVANAYDSVLVVYGAGHFVTQRPALERMFGKPIAELKKL